MAEQRLLLNSEDKTNINSWGKLRNVERVIKEHKNWQEKESDILSNAKR